MAEGKVKGTWGGAREGGGRPKLTGAAVTKQVQFRLTAEQTIIVKHFVKMREPLTTLRSGSFLGSS